MVQNRQACIFRPAYYQPCIVVPALLPRILPLLHPQPACPHLGRPTFYQMPLAD